MLVAMTLLSFIMVAGQQAIALAARAAGSRGDGGHSFLVRRQISDWMETAMPIKSDRRERSPLIFIGEPQSMRFVTVLPDRFGTAGPNIVTFKRSDGGMAMSWQLLRPNADVATASERILLDGVNLVRFRYWDGSDNLGWRDTWPIGQRLPGMVELNLEGGAATGWQPMRVVLRNR
jgi:hypothetical protein